MSTTNEQLAAAMSEYCARIVEAYGCPPSRADLEEYFDPRPHIENREEIIDLFEKFFEEYGDQIALRMIEGARPRT